MRKLKYTNVFKASTYQEAKSLCPKGYRMLKIWELVKLVEEKHPIIFDTEKGNWIFFFSDSIEDNYVHRLDRYWGGYWGGLRVGVLEDSGLYGRVFFVKEKNK